jgi:hypothetical protein
VYKAKEFAASDDLRSIMEELGLISAPEFTWMTPAREQIIWDGELPAFILSHRVYDFDSWLEGYDEAEGLREERGIIGQAVNRSLDDPSVAVAYHQAESFVTGGSAKLYD